MSNPRKAKRILISALKKHWESSRRSLKKLELSLAKILVKFNSNIYQNRKYYLNPPERQYAITEEWFKDNRKRQDGISSKVKFIVAEEALDVNYNKPLIALEQHWNQIFEHRGNQHILPPLFTISIPQGRVWSQFGHVITYDDCLLKDLSIDYAPKWLKLKAKANQEEVAHRVFRDWSLDPIHHLEGRVAVLAQSASQIYFHWMLQVLPRLHILTLSGFDLQDFDYFLVSSLSTSFQKKTLAAFNIPEEKIISMKSLQHICADELVVPSPLIRLKQPYGYRKWIKAFLETALYVKDDDTCKNQYARKIYISRGVAKYRRVLNEDSVIRYLEKLGFVAVELERFSLQEQISIMKSAEIIVAPHGSGLTNLVFCDPGTIVIEIFPTELMDALYFAMSNAFDLQYYCLFGKGYLSHKYHDLNDRKADIWVEIDQLEEILNKAGFA